MKNHDLAEDLSRAETLLHYAKACAEWVERDAYKTCEASILAEENAAIEHLVSGQRLASIEKDGQQDRRVMRQMTDVEAAEIRGFIRAARFIRSLPRVKAEQLETYQTQIAHLRKAIERGQNAPDQTESPHATAFLKDIHTALGARR